MLGTIKNPSSSSYIWILIQWLNGIIWWTIFDFAYFSITNNQTKGTMSESHIDQYHTTLPIPVWYIYFSSFAISFVHINVHDDPTLSVEDFYVVLGCVDHPSCFGPDPLCWLQKFCLYCMCISQTLEEVYWFSWNLSPTFTSPLKKLFITTVSNLILIMFFWALPGWSCHSYITCTGFYCLNSIGAGYYIWFFLHLHKNTAHPYLLPPSPHFIPKLLFLIITQSLCCV